MMSSTNLRRLIPQLAQFTAFFIGSIYFFGFIIVNAYLSGAFGYVSWQIFDYRFAAAGVIFLVSLFLASLVVFNEYFGTKLKNIYTVPFLLLLLIAVLMFQVIVSPALIIETAVLLVSVFIYLFLASYRRQGKFDGVTRQVFSLILIVLLFIILNAVYEIYLFELLLVLVLWAALQHGKVNDYPHELVRFFLFFVVLIGAAVIFGRWIYPRVPSVIGGAKLGHVEVVITKSGDHYYDYDLIEDNESWLVLSRPRTLTENLVVKIPVEEVKVLRYKVAISEVGSSYIKDTIGRFKSTLRRVWRVQTWSIRVRKSFWRGS